MINRTLTGLGLIGALLYSQAALAAGHVSLAKPAVAEANGRWKLAMTIDLGSVPKDTHLPMTLSFKPTVHYERVLLDKTGDKPQVTQVALQNQQAIYENADIDFGDASGKAFRFTRFDLTLSRDHGFEAGEYEAKLNRADNDAQVGQTIKLVLDGDNAVMDRRTPSPAKETAGKAP